MSAVSTQTPPDVWPTGESAARTAAPRVCFVVESGTDVRMAEGLAEYFRLTLIAREIPGGVTISHPPSARFPIATGPASRMRFAWNVFRELLRRRRKCDFVLVQGYALAALAANLFGRLTGTPVAMLVCSPVEAYYLCRREHPDKKHPFQPVPLSILRGLAKLNAIVGKRYIVLSEYLRDVVRSHGTKAEVQIIPIYGIDTELFRPPEISRHQLRHQLGLPRTGSILFFSSRVAPEKDSETLLTAFRTLLDSGRDLWLLHRSGGHKAFLKDAERFGVAHRVLASDAVHPGRDLHVSYQACDVCVQASREEGLGFSPLEALACGVPVIATAVGGLRETIVDDQTGWTYPKGDAEYWALQIADVLDRPDEAVRRTTAGRALVQSRFERKAVFSALAALVQRSFRK
ncbi:MAG TPA: glycosyltransferase family 4 protein [Bryobacteraceae bacterium]|nr:glycosyltransferase family 4 protein [Bryobacteraceae bacterium]